MKKTIEIECPEGYKPIYCAQTGSIKLVPEHSIYDIKTYEDARKRLGYIVVSQVDYNKSVIALAKLQTILNVLNDGCKFNLLSGTIWYPWVRFFRMKSVPKNAEVIGHFRYQDEKFSLVGNLAYNCGYASLSSFDSHLDVGYVSPVVGMLACKSEEIAKYVSTQFGRLVFDACFARHFDEKEFEWID